MTALALPWFDDSRRPVREKAEQLVDLFRCTYPGRDPDYLRTGILDAIALETAGFADVEVIVDLAVQKGCLYAIGEEP